MNHVYLVGNAHLDPVWLWRWQEGYSEVLATFQSALDRMEEFDEFVFTCAGAAYYQWVEETDSVMFERIRERIAQGRWILAGGQYIQPDCNFPRGESFARHALYSQRYFLEKFGKKATFGYNVDSFGHSAMLPQIFRLSGLVGYVYQRPGKHEKEYPFSGQSFLWCSEDGTEMPTFRLENAYCTDGNTDLIEKIRLHGAYCDSEGQPVLCFYGVGNHGGGPTIEQLYDIRKVRESEGEKYRLGSPADYLKELDVSSLPRLTGDLQHHAVGCYSTAMNLKAAMARTEDTLLSAEGWMTAAESLGLGKACSLQKAWEPVLFNQFHDIFGGCCLRKAIVDAMESLSYSKAIAEGELNKALQKIAWNIDTSKGLVGHLNRQDWRIRDQDGLGTPLIVFNPHPFDRTDTVGLLNEFSLVTEDDGTPVPCQSLRTEVTNGDRDKFETHMQASVPALGWKVYWGYGKKDAPTFETGLFMEGDTAENEKLSVTFRNGQIVSLFDKANRREMLAAPLAVTVTDDTPFDTWAHDVNSFGAPMDEITWTGHRVIEKGPVCITVRCSGEYKSSEIQMDATLTAHSEELRLAFTVNFLEKHRILKLKIPSVFTGYHVAGIPFGSIARQNTGWEDPMQGYVIARSGEGGLTAATDSRTGYDSADNALSLTLLRSSLYTDHFGHRDDRCEKFMGLGESCFTISLSPYHDTAEARKRASSLVSPLRCLMGTFHQGKLPATGETVHIDPPHVLIEAVKRAEDGESMMIRLREARGTETKGTVSLPIWNQAIPFFVKPFEIQTLLIDKTGQAKKTDFLE